MIRFGSKGSKNRERFRSKLKET